MINGHSVRTQRRMKAAAGAAGTYRTNQQAKEARMLRGPYTRGREILIPSEQGFYNAGAVEKWRACGFHWERGTSSWVADSTRALKGRLYSVDAWLLSARKWYEAFYPQFAKEVQ